MTYFNEKTMEIEGWQEINRGLKELDGWSNRILKSILAPLDGLAEFPLGRGTPHNANKTKIDWNL